RSKKPRKQAQVQVQALLIRLSTKNANPNRAEARGPRKHARVQAPPSPYSAKYANPKGARSSIPRKQRALKRGQPHKARRAINRGPHSRDEARGSLARTLSWL